MVDEENTKPEWDEELGKSYVGKYILVGVTYVDNNGNETHRQQLHGIIESADSKFGITIALKGVCEGQKWSMPPDQRSITGAQGGTYTLELSGEKIENPDLLVTWTVVEPDPERQET
jgi:hypothetical protein